MIPVLPVMCLIACQPGAQLSTGGDTGPGTSATPTDTAAPTDSSSPTDTTDPTDTQDSATDTEPPTGETFDCGAELPEPQPERQVDGARAYKGIAFDGSGQAYGSDGNSLGHAAYDEAWTLWLPGEGGVEQLAFLSGGDLISTNGYGAGEVKRYTPQGGETVLVGDLGAYSVAIAPNDRIYAAGWDGAWMIDPDTGETTQFLVDGPPDFDRRSGPRSLVFSRDFTKLYIGTIDSDGRIYTLDLDSDYQPVGELQLFATGAGNGWHDGIGLDVCGNVYAVDYASSSLYRVSADGSQVEKLVDWSANSREFGHGLVFGDGVGGWRHDALYLPESENGKRIKEIVLGVPGAHSWDGEVVGVD